MAVYFNSIARYETQLIAPKVDMAFSAGQTSHASTANRRRYQVPQSSKICWHQSIDLTNSGQQTYRDILADVHKR
jgi:hypothetical protein